jgi:hypothetical protein
MQLKLVKQCNMLENYVKASNVPATNKCSLFLNQITVTF